MWYPRYRAGVPPYNMSKSGARAHMNDAYYCNMSPVEHTAQAKESMMGYPRDARSSLSKNIHRLYPPNKFKHDQEEKHYLEDNYNNIVYNPACHNAEAAESINRTGKTDLPSIKIVKNDYNQHFVDTGERPQNFIRDHEPSIRFLEYPKLARLIQLKDEYNKKRAHPPMHIKGDLKNFNWSSLGTFFDVVLIDPPWREYAERATSLEAVIDEDLTPWTFEEMLQYLKIDKIAETPSFCFLWCGTSHLDEGRQLLQQWGFKRCEDICWCKTNRIASRQCIRRAEIIDENGLFQRTTEHCLMGVKGLVKRSSDTHLVHSNIDTDVIIEEEPLDAQGKASASTQKPGELYDMIERFCLGRRKLELFGLDRNIRPGWLTIGGEIYATNYDSEKYLSWFEENHEKGDDRQTIYSSYKGGHFVGSIPEIDQLRPKSPSKNAGRHTATS